MLVTAKKWYMPRRVYGKIIGRSGRRIFIQGSFGLEEFDKSSVREVRSNKRVQPTRSQPWMTATIQTARAADAQTVMPHWRKNERV